MTSMTLAVLLQHFFTERLCTQMQASPHTIASYLSGCETSLALAITRRALGKTEGSLGGLWRGLTSSGAAARRSWTTLSGDRPFRTR
jgi:hypothetical protein